MEIKVMASFIIIIVVLIIAALIIIPPTTSARESSAVEVEFREQCTFWSLSGFKGTPDSMLTPCNNLLGTVYTEDDAPDTFWEKCRNACKLGGDEEDDSNQ